VFTLNFMNVTLSFVLSTKGRACNKH